MPVYMELTQVWLSFWFQNAEMSFNFGKTDFKYPPQGFTSLSRADKDSVSESRIMGSGPAAAKAATNAPQAIIIEPSRELAEQVWLSVMPTCVLGQEVAQHFELTTCITENSAVNNEVI